MLIIDKCHESCAKVEFYVHETVKNSWSRSVLLNYLDTMLFERVLNAKGGARRGDILTLARRGTA